MTPTQKIKQAIIHAATGEAVAAADVDARYDELDDRDGLHDAKYEFRSGGEATGLPCEGSRHYESKAVAAEMLDGSWVGWTYWYGGGKYGEPRTVPWMDDAYEVEVTEVTRVVREFKLKGG